MALDAVTYRLTSDSVSTDQWQVHGVDVHEALNTPYEAKVDVGVPSFDADALVGANVILSLFRPGGQERRLCGIIMRAQSTLSTEGATEATLHIGPAYRVLAHRTDARVFVDKSVVAILKEVLEDALVPFGRAMDFKLTGHYPAREFCMQYNESDEAFATRLMQESGITYYFIHAQATETLVLVDSNEGFARGHCADEDRLSYATKRQGHMEHITNLTHARTSKATGVTVSDYDWTRPKQAVAHAVEGTDAQGRAIHVWAHQDTRLSGYTDTAYKADSAQSLAALQIERQFMQQWDGSRGDGIVSTLTPGHVFSVVHHPNPNYNQKYIITHVTHTGTARRFGNTRDAATECSYRNHFGILPLNVVYRPALVTPPRTIPGLQTATVMGPEGEEIWTDVHGRIKVRFAWDRREADCSEANFAWVRVMQAWAGNAYGAMRVPRVGMEVMVAFMDGDCARPMVIGCAYNGDNALPQSLPEHKTQTVMRSQSTPGGDGHNTLLIEDAAGEEEIYVHAQRDVRCDIGNERKVNIASDDHLNVDGSQHVDVKSDASIEVAGNRHTQVRADDFHYIDGNQELKVGGDALTQVEGIKTTEVTGNMGVRIDGQSQFEAKGMRVTAHGRARVDTQGATELTSEKFIRVTAKEAIGLMADILRATVDTSVVIKQGKAAITISKERITFKAKEIFLDADKINVSARGDLIIKGQKVGIN